MNIFTRVFTNSSLAFLLMLSFLFIGDVRADDKETFFEAGVYSKWKVQDSRDEFTDEYRITAITPIDSSGSSHIVVGCSNNDELYIALSADGADLKTDSVLVNLRVDKQEPISGISGTLLDSGSYGLADTQGEDNSVTALLQQMRRGKRMILRIVDEEDNKSPIYKLSLKGFKKAYRHVVRDCKKNN